jgi:protein-disulfide isomerase
MEEHNEHNKHHSHESGRSKEDTFTIKKDTLWKGAAGIFALLFVISLFMGGISFPGGGNGNAVNVGADGQNAINAKALIENSDPVLGNPDADISIIEFSDFECSYCKRVASGAIADFKRSSYFSDGEVNLIFKHLPLNSIHQYAQKAAEAAECANRQGMFWEYHDTLFENQDSLDITSLKSYAVSVGLDTGEFNSCLDDGEASSEVSKELAQATSVGARGTPYFVVVNNDNGKSSIISGACPWDTFEQGIQLTMDGKSWTTQNCKIVQ